jgi:hypothetical protein
MQSEEEKEQSASTRQCRARLGKTDRPAQDSTKPLQVSITFIRERSCTSTAGTNLDPHQQPPLQLPYISSHLRNLHYSIAWITIFTKTTPFCASLFFFVAPLHCLASGGTRRKRHLFYAATWTRWLWSCLSHALFTRDLARYCEKGERTDEMGRGLVKSYGRQLQLEEKIHLGYFVEARREASPDLFHRWTEIVRR